MAFTTNYGIETTSSEIPMQASASLLLRKLDFVRSLSLNTDCMDGWVVGVRGGESGANGGNFFKFLFYNNFHKILFECVSCLRHLRFLAQQILGLVIFCPLSW